MLNDADLMKRTAAGDEDAFRALVERHGRSAHTFFLRLVRSVEDAEDLTQELFLALYRAAGRYRPEAPFTSYLYRIASNLAASHLRRRAARPAQSLDELAESGFETATSRHDDHPEQSFEEREMRRRYEGALARLPADWRIALELRVRAGALVRRNRRRDGQERPRRRVDPRARARAYRGRDEGRRLETRRRLAGGRGNGAEENMRRRFFPSAAF